MFHLFLKLITDPGQKNMQDNRKRFFRYPLGTLFNRRYAQYADVIDTMHTMLNKDEKGWLKENVLI